MPDVVEILSCLIRIAVSTPRMFNTCCIFILLEALIFKLKVNSNLKKV